jgi:transposase-like protein
MRVLRYTRKSSNSKEVQMKKTRFTEEQIIGILNEVEAGRKVGEVCRAHGISEGTYYRWSSSFASDSQGGVFF